MNWLRKHTYQVHTAAFIVMILSSVALYFSARAGNILAVWIFLAAFITGNILILLVKG
jgi:hypothetical protein